MSYGTLIPLVAAGPDNEDVCRCHRPSSRLVGSILRRKALSKAPSWRIELAGCAQRADQRWPAALALYFANETVADDLGVERAQRAVERKVGRPVDIRCCGKAGS